MRYRKGMPFLWAVLALSVAALAQAQTFSRCTSSGPGRTVLPGVPAAACPIDVTQSSSLEITSGNSVSCNNGVGHTENSYYRAFVLSDFGVTGELSICSVTFGIEEANDGGGTGQPVTVKLYTTSAHPFTLASLTLIGSADVTVSDQALTLLSVPVTATVPAGSELVVEILTPDGQADSNLFFVGSNAAAETGPTYLRAPDCGVTDPTTTAAIGFPDMHMVLQVFGSSSGKPVALAVDPAGNNVLEVGELAEVRPSWKNETGAAVAFTGALANFAGTAGPTYTVTDDTANYGTIAGGATADCTAGSDCYAVQITGTRPTGHLDATAEETVSLDTVGGPVKTWTLHVGESFTDVPKTHAFYSYIETMLHKGITAGCTTTSYCPGNSATRQQMALFTLVAKEGKTYAPPACTADAFTDVPMTSPFCPYVKELVNRGVTSGCGGGNFCPTSPVTRGQMPVFVLKVFDPAMVPAACTTPPFLDVPITHAFCPWIKALADMGYVAGCGGGNYCPASPVTRGQMSVFLARVFGLELYQP